MKIRKEIGRTKMGTGTFVAGMVGGVLGAVWTATILVIGIGLGYSVKQNMDRDKTEAKPWRNDDTI